MMAIMVGSMAGCSCCYWHSLPDPLGSVACENSAAGYRRNLVVYFRLGIPLEKVCTALPEGCQHILAMDDYLDATDRDHCPMDLLSSA